MSTVLGSDTVKRLFDIVVAGCALVVLSPFILALAVTLRVTQGSPIIFRQQRPGMGARPFTIYKFRTMLVSADPEGESDAQRTTRLGRKLRALSLDELPELWNVIRGDMSLVGPRPLLMAYLPRYSPVQARRHEVRPGITGLAQISGRNALTWDQKFALDVRYVDEHDLRMDLDILVRTVTTVLSREGVNSSDDETMPEFMGSGSPGTTQGSGMTIETMPSAAWNQTDRAYPDVLLHEAFAAQVVRDPSAPALRFRDETLTYAQLDERIGELARHLVAMGVRPNTLVAVCMDRSVEMVVALHAILRAGGAYVPLDPEYPDERIDLMLGDLDDPVLLTQQHLTTRFAGSSARVVATDVPLELSSAPGTVVPAVSPDDLAYMIYTSGSTGQPKGAMNTHRGIANRIYWMQEHFELTPADKVLQKTPYSFDVSVWEFFWPLLFGAELVVAEPGGHRDSAYLSQTIIERGITTIHFVPSMLQLFLDDPRASACVSLRRVICSGEALPKAMQDRFFGRLDAELHNLYGPTEAAVDVSVWVCDPDSTLPFVPIGKPIANTQLHILDAEMRPIPVGEVGELHIGGVQVGLGYLKRPDLTAQRFVPDPFRTGGTLYKTGDLARYLPDGNIEFLGRSDFQVKIRGFRVELGEIESTLESVDGVRGAVVVAHERSAGDLELVAYVSHPDGDHLSTDAVRSRLGERLPEYMVPATIIALEQFPLNANGKVDRKALPAPVRTRPLLETPYVAPRTPLQRVLAEKWCRILDLDRVGISDRFFELGGTSLQAARFVNQMQTELHETIFVVTLFGAPSVAEYAAFLERQFPGPVARLLGTPEDAATGTAVITAQTPASGPAADVVEAPGPGTRSTRSRDLLTQQLDRRRAARGR